MIYLYIMATLNELKQQLDIDIDIKTAYLCPGLSRPNKNRYYIIYGALVVELTNDKYMVVSNCEYAKGCLLENFVWNVNAEGYIANGSIGLFHRACLRYKGDKQVDHINRVRYDNRLHNLRIVSPSENMRNLTIKKTNQSGITGIDYKIIGKRAYWRVRIYDNQHKRIEKKYGTTRYGYTEAKRLAYAKRREWEKQYNYIGE